MIKRDDIYFDIVNFPFLDDDVPRSTFYGVYISQLIRSVTSTFNLVTWFFFATHHHIMIIICAKLFSNPTMHNQVISRIGTGFTEVYAQSLSADCDLDL